MGYFPTSAVISSGCQVAIDPIGENREVFLDCLWIPLQIQNPSICHPQGHAGIRQIPAETKRLMELKQQAEKTTGKDSVNIQNKIQKHSRTNDR
jgi:hypothetical protein